MKNPFEAERSLQLKQFVATDLRVFEAMPGSCALLLPDAPRYTVLAATPTYLQDSSRTKEDVIGKGLFEAFPPSSGDTDFTGEKNLSASFETVVATKKEHSLPVQRYDIPNGDGTYTERYWKAVNRPVLADNGTVQYIIHTAEEITSQIKSAQREVAIKGMEQAYNLFMQAPTAIHIFKGPELIIELANTPTLEMWGREGTVTGKPFLTVFPELKGQGYDMLMREVIETGKPESFYEVPVALKRKGKAETSYFNFIYQPYYEEDKTNAIGVLVFATEVTQQVLSRNKATESEQRLELAVEIAKLGVFSVDLSATNLLDCTGTFSKQIADWFGFTELSRKMSDILLAVHQQDKRFVAETLSHSLSRERDGRHDLTYRVINPKSGALYYLRSIGQVLFDKEIPVLISGIIQDVSEQVLSRIKLEESRQNLRNIILQAPVAMCIFRGKDYVVEIANEKMLEVWGKTAEQVIGKPTFDANPEGRGQGFEEILETIYRTGESIRIWEMPTTLLRKGKMEALYTNLSYEPIKEPDGTVSGILVVGIEITDQVLARRRIEEVVAQRTKELAEANQALQRNNQELEQFAYIASHDLQEPLRKVSIFTETLKRHLGEVDDRSKNYLNKITTSTHRMTQLIKDVLNFSQLSSERLVFEPVDLNELIESITIDFELAIEQKGATIHYHNLPVLHAILVQMRQLFGNLLSNALKFISEKVPPVITITAERLPDGERNNHKELLPDMAYYLIEVKDNGIGFSHEYANQIFGIFQRLHGRTEFAGTGIGLALCKKIAQNHHGDIWATSESDTGAEFHIILPAG